MHLNVTSEADWRAAVNTAVQRYGRLNVLVHNAGILLRRGIEDTTEDDWDRLMAVNVKGIFLITKHAIPAMCYAGGGSIINISSIAGPVRSRGAAAYTASKGRCGCLQRPPPCSMPKTTSGAILSIPAPLTPT